MLNVWNSTTVSGIINSLGLIQEGEPAITIDLPVYNIDLNLVKLEVISGKLPPGLSIIGKQIKGVANQVIADTTFTFVIRAKQTVNGVTEIEDRTFSLLVQGPDAPVWVTPAGKLALQPNGLYFVIDNTFVDFQLQATDPDLAAGEVLEYYIEEGDGELPQGLTLTETGRITGLVDPLISLDSGSGTGFFDTNFFDSYPFDLGVATSRFNVEGTISNFTGTITGSSAVTTVTGLNSTAGFFPGMELTKVSGTGAFGQSVTVTAVLSGTSIQITATSANTPGNIEFKSQFLSQVTGIANTLNLSKGMVLTKVSGAGVFGTAPLIVQANDATSSFNFETMSESTTGAVVFNAIGPAATPKKLNRVYEFYVTVTDGESSARRKFSIFVVGDDFLRADNTIIRADDDINTLVPVGPGVFTADNTYLRAPVWLTPSNLGIKRANNYVTIFLTAFDPNPDLGPVIYDTAYPTKEWVPGTAYALDSLILVENVPYICIQAHTSTSNFEFDTTYWASYGLPPGLFLDSTNGELFGFVPYQPAVTRDYRFTISATKYEAQAFNRIEVVMFVLEEVPEGQTVLRITPIPEDEANLLIGELIRIGNSYYTVTDYEGPEITRGSYGNLHLSMGVQSTIPKKTSIIKSFITSSDPEFSTVTSYKTFIVRVLGEVESTISWITNFDLGSVRANLPSRLSVEAKTTVPNAILSYSVVSGSLPSGLSLTSSGNIVGTINALSSPSNITEYQLEILAQDQYKYSGILGNFTLNVTYPDDRSYSNIYVKPFQKQDTRQLFFNFINDSSVFTPSKIYRQEDPNFGVQKELKMLVYAGIETLHLDSYAEVLNTNVKRRRFKLGEAKSAVAKVQGSNDIEYEVVYLEVFDIYEEGLKSVSPVLDLSNARVIDRVYPSSITNIRNKIKHIQVATRQILTENEFLPLWMLTPQDSRTAATGFIKCIPLCYCNPGESDYILQNIKNSGFSFIDLDYEIDRFIITRTTNVNRDQYLSFNNYKFNV